MTLESFAAASMANFIYKKSEKAAYNYAYLDAISHFILFDRDARTILLPAIKGSVREKRRGRETKRNLQVSHGKFPRGLLAA